MLPRTDDIWSFPPVGLTGAAGENVAMLDYAWRVMTTRPSLWVPSAGCALLAALPGSIAALYLTVPLTAFVLTGNPALALDVAPAPFNRPAPAFVAVLVAATAGLALWCRLYAAAVWASDDRKEPGVRSAFRGSRGRWLGVFLLYACTYVALAAGLGITMALLGVIGTAPAALAVALVAGSALLAGRAILRIALTLAVRATVLDGEPATRAWARGLRVLKSKVRAVVAVWIALLATGAMLWIGGRLISPVLQDTALDYPRSSAFVAYREIAQLALAVPLETLLLTLSLGVWTALYAGRDEHPRRPSRVAPGTLGPSRSANPWVIKALIVLVVLTVISNGIPTLVDRAWNRSQERTESAIEAEEIQPEDAIRSVAGNGASQVLTSYDVEASLEDSRLRWATRIDYINTTGEPLEDIGVHVYPAAYTRDPAHIPLGRDLVTGDFSGEFQSRARPGTLTLERVTVDDNEAGYTRDQTELLIDLPSSLRPGRRAVVEIELVARLPEFPERFGVWDDMTLLGNWIPVVALHDGDRWRMDGFPSIGDPFAATVADYHVSIEAEEHMLLAGSGVLESVVQDEPGTRTWKFVAKGARDAAFVAAPFLRGLEERSAGVTVRSWYSAEDRVHGQANLITASSAVAHYTDRYGALPFDEVEVVATKGLLGGMEYPGIVFASDTSRALAGTPLLPELIRHAGVKDAQSRYLIGHEVAHQWWYASVGNDQVEEPWLDEALAEVAVRLWLRSVEGDDRTWEMTHFMTSASPRRGVVAAGIEDFSSNEAYTDAVYVAGSEVLMKLREQTGAAAFEAILREWHRRTQLELGTIDEFIETVEAVAGRAAGMTVTRYR